VLDKGSGLAGRVVRHRIAWASAITRSVTVADKISTVEV